MMRGEFSAAYILPTWRKGQMHTDVILTLIINASLLFADIVNDEKYFHYLRINQMSNVKASEKEKKQEY